MNNFKNLLAYCALIAAMAGCILPAFGQPDKINDVILPFPGDITSAVFVTYPDASGFSREAILLDGIPIAYKYDDAWSYSMNLLIALLAAGFIPDSYGNYTDSAGVGSVDAVLFTQSGNDNDPVGVGKCCVLEEPGPTVSGNTVFVDSWWGQVDQNNDRTLDTDDVPNTVGAVL